MRKWKFIKKFGHYKNWIDPTFQKMPLKGFFWSKFLKKSILWLHIMI